MTTVNQNGRSKKKGGEISITYTTEKVDHEVSFTAPSRYRLLRLRAATPVNIPQLELYLHLKSIGLANDFCLTCVNYALLVQERI